jgi:hypothetical protein
MPNIKLSYPADLTAAQIRRVNPSINEETARELAAELHDIVAYVQSLYATQPRGEPTADFEESDVIQTLLRTALDFWPRDEGAAGNESIWLMEMLTFVGGDELYLRYMRLCDRVNGTDLVTEFNLASSAPPTPKTDAAD